MVQLTETDRHGGSGASEHFRPAAIVVTSNSYPQGQPTIKAKIGLCRSFRPGRHRKYGLPSSDFPPSRLVKYSPKHQYARILNFPYLGAHFQPRMNTIVVEVQGISHLNDPSNPSSAAASGVYYGPGCARNRSFRIPVQAKQTANLAVLESIRCVLNDVITMRTTDFIPGWKELIIMTKSEYAKNSLSLWVWQWEKSGWNRAGNKEPIENIEVMQDIHKLITYMERSLDMSVRFWKVDREDIAGADGLAQKALGGPIAA